MIDIGHVDLEYEWMKNGVLQQEKVKGKYVNGDRFMGPR